MAGPIKAKLILQLRAAGMFQTRIAVTQSISINSIRSVWQRADELSLLWEDVESKSDDEVYALLCPEKDRQTQVYADPDWEHIHKEFAKTIVTLKLLHAEYTEDCACNVMPAMSYDRFCKRYNSYTIKENVVSRVGHKTATGTYAIRRSY